MSKEAMPADGGGKHKGAPDGVAAAPGGDGERGVNGRTEGGESGGGAYPNPHTGKTPNSGGFSGGQSGQAYHGGGQGGEQGGDAPNAATGSDSSDGTEEGSSAWTSPTYAPHVVHAEGQTFEIVATNGIAEAVQSGNVAGSAGDETEEDEPARA